MKDFWDHEASNQELVNNQCTGVSDKLQASKESCYSWHEIHPPLLWRGDLGVGEEFLVLEESFGRSGSSYRVAGYLRRG